VISPGSAQAFEANRDVDTVAEDVPVLDDDVAHIYADPKVDGLVGWYNHIPLGPMRLYLGGAAERIYHTAELDEEAVTHRLDEPAVMRGDRRIDQLGPDRRGLSESAALVLSHQPRIARDIGGEDRRETARCSRGYRLARPSAPVGDAAIDEYAPVGHPVSPAILKRA